ncbi:MAG TPA: hypothetical protein VM638_07430 [Actinomycetota bacterium]|nr:hypothetical protein [Actinomycetota bacterium]
MADEHNLVLILARGLASSIATPVFLVDPEGTLVYFNEPAEGILGQSYADSGSMTLEEWGTRFRPIDPGSGTPIPPEDLPLGIALTHRRPAHGPLHIVGADGVAREIAVTALPLFAKSDEFIGAMAIFWEAEG